MLPCVPINLHSYCRVADSNGSAFYRDHKVVEKQRETLGVDRLPSALAATASKSVQVNGAATVRARHPLRPAEAALVPQGRTAPPLCHLIFSKICPLDLFHVPVLSVGYLGVSCSLPLTSQVISCHIATGPNFSVG